MRSLVVPGSGERVPDTERGARGPLSPLAPGAAGAGTVAQDGLGPPLTDLGRKLVFGLMVFGLGLLGLAPPLTASASCSESSRSACSSCLGLAFSSVISCSFRSWTPPGA